MLSIMNWDCGTKLLLAWTGDDGKLERMVIDLPPRAQIRHTLHIDVETQSDRPDYEEWLKKVSNG